MQGRGENPLRSRLTFAPPFVFIRGSRGTLTATCRSPLVYASPFLFFSFLSPSQGPREESTRSTRLSSGDRNVDWKSLSPRDGRAKGKNGTRVTRRASHDYVIFSRAFATRLYYSYPRHPRSRHVRFAFPSDPVCKKDSTL